MLGNISLWQLAIVLAVVVLVFGGGKLRHLGGDIGAAINGFKKAMNDDATSPPLGDLPTPGEQTASVEIPPRNDS